MFNFSIFFMLSYLIMGNLFYAMFICFFKNISFNYFTKFFLFFWFFLNIICFKILLFIYFFNLSDFNLIFFIQFNQISFLDNFLNINLNITNICFIYTISIISFFANYHTYIYMQYDQKKEKFICLLNGFAFSMVNLVISKNLLLLFLFWELLGLTSFLLINHNDTQIQSQKSSFKAFIFNKFSDFFFIIGLILFSFSFNTLNINNNLLLLYANNNNNLIINIALFFIFFSSIIKSVQIFTFFWLPDSMKAPAPASALIHSATLVAAGFYIILIFKEYFIYFWGVNFFIYIGIATSIFGSIIAASQYDLKKILAYSTIANCGFMLTLLNLFDIEFFLIYFILHGLFKSVCFMLAGNLIILQNHEQDTRLFSRYNFTYFKTIKILSCLIFCLAGAPFGVLFLIKHSYIILLNNNDVWLFYDIFLIFYGFFSLLYAFNFFFKSMFLIYNFKKNNKLKNKINTQITDLIYCLIALLISFFFYVILQFFKQIDFNYTTQNINLYYLFIFFTLNLLNLFLFLKLNINVGWIYKQLCFIFNIILLYFCLNLIINTYVSIFAIITACFKAYTFIFYLIFMPKIIHTLYVVLKFIYNAIKPFFKK